MRFALTSIPGLLAATLLWHEVVDCYPYKVTSPSIAWAAHLALALALVATFVVSGLAAVRPGWAWPVLSAVVGTSGSLIPLAWAHHLAATLPLQPDYEFNWHSSVLSLDRAVPVTFTVALVLSLALAAVLALPALRRPR